MYVYHAIASWQDHYSIDEIIHIFFVPLLHLILCGREKSSRHETLDRPWVPCHISWIFDQIEPVPWIFNLPTGFRLWLGTWLGT